MFETISYTCLHLIGITWKFPWNRFGKECLKLFCIRVWAVYGISWKFPSNRFGKECKKLHVFCYTRVVLHNIKISMESFWQRMFETILYTCMVFHGNFHEIVLALIFETISYTCLVFYGNFNGTVLAKNV